MHQDFILNTAGSKSSELRALVWAVALNGLDQTDGADGLGPFAASYTCFLFSISPQKDPYVFDLGSRNSIHYVDAPSYTNGQIARSGNLG
ncbi:hypothetical protein A3842_03675 [Paenibacillus sp. P3E]|nr:hypothetical protein A3842_03675 [Paenibacillus sp. P3E]